MHDTINISDWKLIIDNYNSEYIEGLSGRFLLRKERFANMQKFLNDIAKAYKKAQQQQSKWILNLPRKSLTITNTQKELTFLLAVIVANKDTTKTLLTTPTTTNTEPVPTANASADATKTRLGICAEQCGANTAILTTGGTNK